MEVYEGEILKLDVNDRIPYGTAAQPIYERCCYGLGWDISQSGKFAMQKKLYASKAAENKYSVWFICYCNLTGTKGGAWKNTFKEGTNIIEEEHEIDGYLTYGDIRITFFKQYKHYYFIGIYKQVRSYINEKGNVVLVYERISKKYPM